jgi:DNA topoisomerase-2
MCLLVLKSSIIDNVLNWAKFKADQQIKKTDGTKRNRQVGVIYALFPT